MSGLDIIPKRSDLLSVAFAGLGAWAMKKGNPGMEMVEQLASVIIGKNLAGTIDSTDGFEGVTLKEYDLYTAGSRAGISLFQKGGQQQVMFSAFSGIASNLLARFVDTKLVAPL